MNPAQQPTPEGPETEHTKTTDDILAIIDKERSRYKVALALTAYSNARLQRLLTDIADYASGGLTAQATDVEEYSAKLMSYLASRSKTITFLAQEEEQDDGARTSYTPKKQRTCPNCGEHDHGICITKGA